MSYGRLLVFNLRTDADDHILGFTSRWIKELAPYYSAIDVLTTHAGRIDLADNVRVYSVGREKGVARPQRTVNFYRQLASLLVRNRYSACFAHMQPLFAVMGAPLLQAAGVRTTTWYTQYETNWQVKWAEHLSYRIVSASEMSFPIKTPKLRAIGHGIDTDLFQPAKEKPKTAKARIVYVARLTEVKRQHILLEAVKDLDCEVVLIGDVPDGYGSQYKAQIVDLVQELGLDEKVIFTGALTPEQVVDWSQSARVGMNLSPSGSFDKAVLENMAMGIPVISCNDAFEPLHGTYHAALHISSPDAVGELKERLSALFSLPEANYRQMAADLRANVVREHSLPALIQRLIAVMHTGEIA